MYPSRSYARHLSPVPLSFHFPGSTVHERPSLQVMAGVKSHENLPVKVLREILKDLKSIDDSPPEGIRMIVNEDNISTIHADIEGPGKTQVMCCGAVLLTE